MQKVSKAYKDSMKSALRERGYIMISFGLLNQEAQAKAKVEKSNFTYYSDSTNVFAERTEKTTYATLEENFTRVDGSMVFLPRQNQSAMYLDTGIISDNLISNAQFELTINLNIAATDIKGMTIDFGENYPLDFDMVGSTGQVIQIRNNDKALFTSEEILNDITSLKLVFYRMKNPKSRVRIYNLKFGYGLVYYNKEVLSSTLESYVSPIGADIPQIDFSVTVKNNNHYFDINNPESAINFFETGQEMEIYYGYQLPNSEEIEWIKGNHLFCTEWESDDYTATIRCADIFRNSDNEYYRGMYHENGISFYDMAIEVLKDAGITEYYVDPHLKELFTKNPVPKSKHKEALQIIANACRCVLSQTREGKVQIKSSFIPDMTASAETEAPYSKVGEIVKKTTNHEYGSLATDYTIVDGSMFFVPRTGSYTLNTGYVSEEISNADGTFTKNPIITIQQEAACKFYGFKLTFGNALPKKFIVRTYFYGAAVTEFEVGEDEISQTMIVYRDFDDFDKMTIEFVQTAEPLNRITLNQISFDDLTSFTMTRNDMLSSPKTIKGELVKDVIVPCYSYQKNTQEESLVSQEVTVNVNEIITFYLGDPACNIRATFNDSAGNVDILEQGNFFVTLKFKIAGTYRVDIYGYQYKISERYVVYSLNNRGKTVKWENPLISDSAMAADLAEWLGNYYRTGIEYEYDTRGNPELDTGDTIYQQNEFTDKMKVAVYRQTLKFDQTFSGMIIARRIGGTSNVVKS